MTNTLSSRSEPPFLPPPHPSMHRYSARPLGTAPPDRRQSAGVLGQETGAGSLQEEEGVYMWRPSAEGVMSPLLTSVNSVGARQ
ncbi:hypothetical protein NQZ68_002078 [Dissostichus eleginoides]|nr:hypothetical protein NQZ68_002078 [Dissostichus eleginoides]